MKLRTDFVCCRQWRVVANQLRGMFGAIGGQATLSAREGASPGQKIQSVLF